MKKAGLSELVMFDNDRNMTRGKAPNGTLQRFEYDEAGRVIVTKTDAGVAIETNTYGTSRERLKKETGTDAGAKRTYYAWGGTSVICEYSETGSQATMGWSKAYVYAGSRLLSTSTKNGATEKLEYHHPDRLGTKLVSDPVGSTFKEQATLPFGTSIDSETSGVSGSGSSGTGAPSNQRFTSYDRSGATGLDYAVNRTYNSGQSRFTTVDPIGMASASIGDPQSLNLFAYVGNNPVDFVDSIGLEKHFPGFLDWLYEEKGIAYAGNGKDMYGNDVDIDIGMFIEFTRTLDENPNCILNANPGSRLTTDPHEMIVPKLRWENGRFVEDPSANDHDGVHIVNPTPGESNFMALPSMKGKVLHYGIQSFNEPYVSVLDISIEASVDGDPLVLTIKDMSWKKRAYSRNQKIKSGQILGVVTSRRNFKGEISEASGAHVTLMTLSTYKKYIAGRQSGAARRSVPVSELIDVYNDSRSPFNCP